MRNHYDGRFGSNRYMHLKSQRTPEDNRGLVGAQEVSMYGWTLASNTSFMRKLFATQLYLKKVDACMFAVISLTDKSKILFSSPFSVHVVSSPILQTFDFLSLLINFFSLLSFFTFSLTSGLYYHNFEPRSSWHWGPENYTNFSLQLFCPNFLISSFVIFNKFS